MHPQDVQRTIRVPRKEYEAMKETIEILEDEEAVKSIARGLEDIRKGRRIPHSVILKKKRH